MIWGTLSSYVIMSILYIIATEAFGIPNEIIQFYSNSSKIIFYIPGSIRLHVPINCPVYIILIPRIKALAKNLGKGCEFFLLQIDDHRLHLKLFSLLETFPPSYKSIQRIFTDYR